MHQAKQSSQRKNEEGRRLLLEKTTRAIENTSTDLSLRRCYLDDEKEGAGGVGGGPGVYPL